MSLTLAGQSGLRAKREREREWHGEERGSRCGKERRPRESDNRVRLRTCTRSGHQAVEHGEWVSSELARGRDILRRLKKGRIRKI